MTPLLIHLQHTDPCCRPWYVETATPTPKDLVLVIDTSSSMELHNRMTIAKRAAKTVVKTLNPNDRVKIFMYKSITNVVLLMPAPFSSAHWSINCSHRYLYGRSKVIFNMHHKVLWVNVNTWDVKRVQIFQNHYCEKNSSKKETAISDNHSCKTKWIVYAVGFMLGKRVESCTKDSQSIML